MGSVLFTTVENDQAILYQKGTFRQTTLYTRKGYLHARVGFGYVLMKSNHETSRPDIRWVEIENNDNYETDRLGRLRVRGTNQEL